MAHPYFHALSSVRRWGGEVNDYLPIHSFFDQTKSALADCRHRLFLHNAWGADLMTSVFSKWKPEEHNGATLEMLAEQHMLEDFGEYMPLSACLEDVVLVIRRPFSSYRFNKDGDWSEFENFFVSPKKFWNDDRSYALVLNSYAPFLLEQKLGSIYNVPGVGIVQTRYIAERIILHMSGRILPLSDIAKNVAMKKWMCRQASALSKQLEDFSRTENNNDDLQQ